jgi:crotonobetainyl-CoA:carnitine CoA-transferase CaiB-like acyl-CoA transferase
VTGALEGVRVLDLTRYIPGPYCTLLLGDLGADVVKVEEPPMGDLTRGIPPAVGGDSAAHAALNRNKRSAVVDLRSGAGVGVMRRLAARADVLVESFRPGVLERRGLGAATLRAENPRLVYCSVTGYGKEGPLASRAGHDIDYSALSGLLGMLRDPEGRPTLPSAQLTDMAGGLVGTIAVLAGLAARERTGRGQEVDVSLLHAALALGTVPLTRSLAGGTSADELGGAYACYRVYRCRDGRYLAVGALESKFWQKLCRALDRPDLVSRQWQRGSEGREVGETLEVLFAARDRDEWVRRLSGLDACVEPVLDLEEAAGAPQGRLCLSEQRSGAAAFRTVATPFRLSGTPPSVRRSAPALGQHTDEVLREAGFSAPEIAGLRKDGVVA